MSYGRGYSDRPVTDTSDSENKSCLRGSSHDTAQRHGITKAPMLPAEMNALYTLPRCVLNDTSNDCVALKPVAESACPDTGFSALGTGKMVSILPRESLNGLTTRWSKPRVIRLHFMKLSVPWCRQEGPPPPVSPTVSSFCVLDWVVSRLCVYTSLKRKGSVLWITLSADTRCVRT